MEEKPISYGDSLKIIEQMIETTRNKVTRLDSMYSLMWGYLVLAASLLSYFLLKSGYGAKAHYAWFLMFAGGAASVFISIKRNRERRVRTYFDKVLLYVWSGFVVSLLILVANGQYFNFQIIPLILLLYGIALLINGGIFNFRPQIIGAIVSWAGCLLAFRVAYIDQLLIEAFVVIVSYIIPGHILYRMAKQNV